MAATLCLSARVQASPTGVETSSRAKVATPARAGLDASWKSLGQFGGVDVYEKDGLTLSITDGQTPVERNLNAANYQTVLSQSLMDRQPTMLLLGYENWKSSAIRWQEIGPKKLTEVEGTYTKDDHQFQFIEWDAYLGRRLIMYTLEAARDNQRFSAVAVQIKKNLVAVP